MIMLLNILIGAALLAVAATLVMGFANMTRRDAGAAARSNILMRWRVGLQAVALVLLVIGIAAKSALAG